MRIAVLTNSFPKISETFVTNQLVTLLERNHEVEIFAFNDPHDGEVHDAIEKHALRRRTTYMDGPESVAEGMKSLLRSSPRLIADKSVGFRAWSKLVTQGKRAPRQCEVLQALSNNGASEYDIVHAHFGPVGDAARPAADVLDVPLIVSFYGHDASELVTQNPNRYEGLFAAAAKVLVLSDDMEQRLASHGCPTAKMEKLPLMVDVDKYPVGSHRKPTDHVTLITVARLVEKKGIKYALEAFDRINDEYEIEFKIVGDGPERNDLESLVRQKGLEEVVTFHGYQNHRTVKQLLSDSDLFILPSVTAANGDREGTPTILLEAQSVGLPVVSTRHAGIPEIVQDGVSGFLVPERDIDALEESLRRLLESPRQWQKMGEAGRRFVRNNHDPSVLGERLEYLYESVQRPS